jgi:hypothetical protein
MGYVGAYLGQYLGSYLGSVGSVPVLHSPYTTRQAIRDFIVMTIKALTPTTFARDRYVPHRNDGNGDLIAWAQKNPAAAFRRYQVRYQGADIAADSGDTSFEGRWVRIAITVAYPQNNRTGSGATMDRDDVASGDRFQIEQAIGLSGDYSITSDGYGAKWLTGPSSRIRGQGVDFSVITMSMRFDRNV